MNKHALNGLIQDVQLQLHKNTDRLNRHLSKNEREQILAENEAIANTIAKLKQDLKGVNEVDEGTKKDQDNQEEQHSFTKPLGLVEKEKEEKKQADMMQQFQDAFSDSPQVNQDETSKEWEEAFSTETQMGVANKN